jgi:hypothetical protein
MKGAQHAPPVANEEQRIGPKLYRTEGAGLSERLSVGDKAPLAPKNEALLGVEPSGIAKSPRR